MATAEHRKVHLQTVGCRLNQYETERMAGDLYKYGYRRADNDEEADICLINTCTVTHRADADNRYLIKRARRQHPNAFLIVAGCYVDSDKDSVAGTGVVDLLIPNRDKDRLVEIIEAQAPHLLESDVPISEEDTLARFDRYNRAWVKISDGCNQGCAFCILPSVRGGLTNRPSHKIIDEINGLVGLGFAEVALTGLHIGLYSDPTNKEVASLAKLCELILEKTELGRIRLSSIEPQTVRQPLLDVYVNAGLRICRHFHVPFQSGSARLLKAMRRPYTLDTYREHVERIRTVEPDTVVGADVIVGFPGETDEDFMASCVLADSGLIDYLHVFSYSDRPGTRASELGEKVNPEVIKERNAILSEISNRRKRQMHDRQVGRILPVIPRHNKPTDGSPFIGVADNYVMVKLPDSYPGGRGIVDVKIVASGDDFVISELA